MKLKGNNVKNIDFVKITKIALGSMISMIIAASMGLAYSTSAGVITLLSIQNTKKETIFIALRRCISFLAAILVARGMFFIFGYNLLSFGLFLFVFVGISYKAKLEDGISVNAVLMTHILVEKSMSYNWIINEALLLTIGAGIGILLNLYMPTKKNEIKNEQKNIEYIMKAIIESLAQGVLGENKIDNQIEKFYYLNSTLKVASNKAYENMNNTFIVDTRYYIDYIDMRRSQAIVLKTIYANIALLSNYPKQCYRVSKFISDVSDTYHEYNNVKELLVTLNNLRQEMKEELLPTSREEFENRAILFVVLGDFESFLQLKGEFVRNLTKDQISTYWNEYK